MESGRRTEEKKNGGGRTILHLRRGDERGERMGDEKPGRGRQKKRRRNIGIAAPVPERR